MTVLNQKFGLLQFHSGYGNIYLNFQKGYIVVHEPSAAFRIVECNLNSIAKTIFPDVNKLLGILHFYCR